MSNPRVTDVSVPFKALNAIYTTPEETVALREGTVKYSAEDIDRAFNIVLGYFFRYHKQKVTTVRKLRFCCLDAFKDIPANKIDVAIVRGYIHKEFRIEFPADGSDATIELVRFQNIYP
jgi:hypothetical protein